MKLSRLELQNFKNYQSIILELAGGIHFFVGLNGSGKTNILDAIHYLAFTKSSIQASDTPAINHQEEYFLIKGQFWQKEEEINLQVYVDKARKKEIRNNSTPYEKFADHIGKIPLVMVVPEDQLMVRESSETRRKWLDGCLSQSDHVYLEKLLQYQKLIKQKHQLLKSTEGRASRSTHLLLDTYDAQLKPLNEWIATERSKFLQTFDGYFKQNLSALVPTHEKATIRYQSQIDTEGFEHQFKQAREKDLMMQRCTMGIHKDDLAFMLDDHTLKRFGSQGQQKSFLLALKLGQYDYLYQQVADKPILLLDDLFDKLDDDRIQNLMRILEQKDRFDQVMITDARKDRSVQLSKSLKNVSIFEIKQNHAFPL